MAETEPKLIQQLIALLKKKKMDKQAEVIANVDAMLKADDEIGMMKKMGLGALGERVKFALKVEEISRM